MTIAFSAILLADFSAILADHKAKTSGNLNKKDKALQGIKLQIFSKISAIITTGLILICKPQQCS
jgi:hypothetical protein